MKDARLRSIVGRQQRDTLIGQQLSLKKCKRDIYFVSSDHADGSTPAVFLHDTATRTTDFTFIPRSQIIVSQKRHAILTTSFKPILCRPRYSSVSSYHEVDVDPAADV